MGSPDKAIAAIRNGSSLAWAFYRPEEANGEDEVEIRLNATPEAVAAFAPPTGWTLNRIQWGDTLFLRRHQSLKRDAVEQMLVEVTSFAAANDFKFHSWLHGRDIDEE